MSKKSIQDTNVSLDSENSNPEVKIIDRIDFLEPSAIQAIIDSYFPLLFDIQKKSPNLKKKDLTEIALKLNLALGQVSETSELIDEIILQEIFFEKGKHKKNLIPILQAVQSQFSYLSKFNMSRIANFLDITLNEVYAVASFYSQFKFEKPGKHKIVACSGTACFIKNSPMLIELVERDLGIKPGQTTQDGLFTFETVACLGCCALSPVMVIDGEIYGKMTTKKYHETIEKIKSKY